MVFQTLIKKETPTVSISLFEYFIKSSENQGKLHTITEMKYALTK